MYISIDIDGLRFLHKHADVHTVANLVWIECDAELAVDIEPVDSPNFLTRLTEEQLGTLYYNTTDEVSPLQQRGALLKLVQELAQRAPDAPVNPFEADQQADKVPEAERGQYRFTKHSMKPRKALELFPIKVKALSADAAKQHVKQTSPVPAPTPAAERPVQRPVAPRTGSVKETVTATANRFWEAAGKPLDTKVLLALRKEVMDELEQVNRIRRTTASSQLGQWMKGLVPE